MKKKAITPLISSLLLIFFAIVLGVLVMSWGKTSYTMKEAESCENTRLSIISVNDELQACYKNNRVYLTLENNGEAELSGVKISVIGSKDIYQTELGIKMNAADIKRLETNYNANVGEIMQLRLAPKISLEKLCANSIFKVDNIRECS